MAEISLVLPKLHVYFKTDKTAAEVRSEILGPLANGYENLIQTVMDNAGQTGLTAEVIRKQNKVTRDGDRWMVYLKCWVHGETNLSMEQIRQGWANKKSAIKTAAKNRIEHADFGGTEVRFNFKRLDGQEAAEES